LPATGAEAASAADTVDSAATLPASIAETATAADTSDGDVVTGGTTYNEDVAEAASASDSSDSSISVPVFVPPQTGGSNIWVKRSDLPRAEALRRLRLHLKRLDQLRRRKKRMLTPKELETLAEVFDTLGDEFFEEPPELAALPALQATLLGLADDTRELKQLPSNIRAGALVAVERRAQEVLRQAEELRRLELLRRKRRREENELILMLMAA
jgi:hypothetical protein